MIILGVLFGGVLTILVLALYGTHLVMREMAHPPLPQFSRNAQAFNR